MKFPAALDESRFCVLPEVVVPELFPDRVAIAYLLATASTSKENLILPSAISVTLLKL